MIHHYITKYWEDGKHYAEAWLQINIFGKAYCFSRRRIVIQVKELMDDLISRQAAIDAIFSEPLYESGMKKRDADAVVPAIYEKIKLLPSAQQEPNYCRECKWSRCRIYAGKHGESETYWRCLNWDGETDEEGYCHEWERKTYG